MFKKMNRPLNLAPIGLIVVLLLILGIVGCNTPTPTSIPSTNTPVPPTNTPVPPTNTPTPTPTNTSTPTPIPPTATNTPVPPTATPTKPPVIDLSGAKLTVEDFPVGFQQLTAAELKQLGMSEASLTQAFSGVSTQAKPQNFTAFLNPTKFHLVMSLLIYPMTTLEKAAFDLQLSNPDTALKQFGTGFGGSSKVSILPGYDEIGDKSIGFTTALASGALIMRMDMVIVSRGNAIEMIISMYQDSTQPPANLTDLTKILDTRTAAGLGIKQ